VRNAGEFPTLTDQGEQRAAPQRRPAAGAPAKRNAASEAKTAEGGAGEAALIASLAIDRGGDCLDAVAHVDRQAGADRAAGI